MTARCARILRCDRPGRGRRPAARHIALVECGSTLEVPVRTASWRTGRATEDGEAADLDALLTAMDGSTVDEELPEPEDVGDPAFPDERAYARPAPARRR